MITNAQLKTDASIISVMVTKALKNVHLPWSEITKKYTMYKVYDNIVDHHHHHHCRLVEDRRAAP